MGCYGRSKMALLLFKLKCGISWELSVGVSTHDISEVRIPKGEVEAALPLKGLSWNSHGITSLFPLLGQASH